MGLLQRLDVTYLSEIMTIIVHTDCARNVNQPTRRTHPQFTRTGSSEFRNDGALNSDAKCNA